MVLEVVIFVQVEQISFKVIEERPVVQDVTTVLIDVAYATELRVIKEVKIKHSVWLVEELPDAHAFTLHLSPIKDSLLSVDRYESFVHGPPLAEISDRVCEVLACIILKDDVFVDIKLYLVHEVGVTPYVRILVQNNVFISTVH